MNNTENNILIAKFMGAYPVEIEDKEGFWYLIEGLFPHGYSKVMIGGSKYHSSWDWLMPVVEKIESILPNNEVVTIEYKDCKMLTDNGEFYISENAGTKIQAVYNAVIEFIKWYNENKTNH